MIDWILLIQQNIETYNQTILEKSELSSDFIILYNRATDSYFSMILRNLVDKDTKTSSIITFLEQFIEDEFNSLLSHYNKKNYSDHENTRLQNFSKVIKEIREKQNSIKKYIWWINNWITHFNTDKSGSMIKSESWYTQYSRQPTAEIIIEINCLLNLFQELITYLSDSSEINNYQFRSIDKNKDK